MKNYYLQNNKFIIENYLDKSPFSNFLPGLAGKKGIPLWAFYVNRGQGISGFGLQDKNHPIMEFYPANKAYEIVSTIGFRTFIKVNQQYYEPFLPNSGNIHRMYIERSSFQIEEENLDLGIRILITYFGLPNEDIGALGRKVEVTNISNKALDLEIIDGITQIIPAGVTNQEFKAVSNLFRSWMGVDELDENIAFYKMRSSTGDQSEVKEIKSGNFLFGFVNDELVKPLVDKDFIFGNDSSKKLALRFLKNDYSTFINKEQVIVNKVPCGFIPYKKVLESGETLNINIFSGFTYSKELLYEFLEKAKTKNYLNKKLKEASDLIEDIVSDVESSTNIPVFDEFVKQSYLDNLLRGGYPTKIGDKIYHLYSRRHGDLERDYNFFSLAPEFYSQGGGNFRDVCQNRRLDSSISRDVKSHNIKHFASLIQLDGYNPLTVNGLTFKIESYELRKALVDKYFDSNKERLIEWLGSRFTPGGLVNYITVSKTVTKTSDEVYLNDIISSSESFFESAFGEGYWSDHFTYIIDLVEKYQGVYPDKIANLLYKENDILTFESPVTVVNRDQKAVINSKNNIRQYGSILHFDQDKINRLNLNSHGSNWVKLNNHDYKTNLYTKLLILTLNKNSQLDCDELGIEMEAEKPGWNDAMNGLPGLFGSGTSETIELKRIVDFLIKNTEEVDLELPVEVSELLSLLKQNPDYFARINIRESYRSKIRFGLSGELELVSTNHVLDYLKQLSETIDNSLNKLLDELTIIPTYITHEVTKYEELKNNGKPVIGNYKLPLVRPLEYKKRYLPNFIEAPARLLKLDIKKSKLRKMYQQIKVSDIYDKELKIYKTSGKLEAEEIEIGRIRAFTEGWLERESSFLHMVYKYVLGLLKAGMYEEFFEEIKNNLVCFMDPNVYGRNILENSSFIVPTNNPDKEIHGKGFLPRLSGSTIEALDIWYTMMTGGKPFIIEDNKLLFKPNPKIQKEFFKEDGTLSFNFMKDTLITYHNEDMIDTYKECKVYKIELTKDNSTETFMNEYVHKDQALKIRDGFYNKIDIYIKKIK